MSVLCATCGREFKNAAGLKRHVMSKNGCVAKNTDGEKPVENAGAEASAEVHTDAPTTVKAPKVKKASHKPAAAISKNGPILPGMYNNIDNAIGEKCEKDTSGVNTQQNTPHQPTDPRPHDIPHVREPTQERKPFYFPPKDQRGLPFDNIFNTQQNPRAQYQPQTQPSQQSTQPPPFPQINTAETHGMPTEAKLQWALEKIQQLSDEVMRLRNTTDTTINIMFDNSERNGQNYQHQIVYLTQVLDVQWEKLVEPIMSKVSESGQDVNDLLIRVVNSETGEAIATLSGLWLTEKASKIIPIMHNLRRAITQEALTQYQNAVRDINAGRYRGSSPEKQLEDGK